MAFLMTLALAATLYAAEPPAAAPAASPVVAAASKADELFKQGFALIFENDAAGDPARGRALLEQAAALGHASAMNALAAVYEQGIGVPPDPVKARDFMERAAAAGDAPAQLNLGIRLIQDADPAAQVRGAALLAGAAEDEWAKPFASAWLGQAYLFGLGVETDVKKGVDLLLAADKAGVREPAAAFLLGRTYADGWGGVTPDPVRSAAYFRQAAEMDHARSAWELGMDYLNGHGVEKDLAKAAAYVRQAAEAGDTNGQISMAVMMALGQGMAEDDAQARTWYRRAAEQGSAHGLRGLAFMLLTGEGGPVDRITGTAYAELAKDGGDEMAGALVETLTLRTPTLEERRRIDGIKADWRKAYPAPK